MSQYKIHIFCTEGNVVAESLGVFFGLVAFGLWLGHTNRLLPFVGSSLSPFEQIHQNLFRHRHLYRPHGSFPIFENRLIVRQVFP